MTTPPAYIASVVDLFSSSRRAPICNLPAVLCPLRELSLNEFGDFVAGAFGGLAFLWLLITVILQSEELRRQAAESLAISQSMQEQLRYLSEGAAREEARLQDEGLRDDIVDVLRRYVAHWPKTFSLQGAVRRSFLNLPQVGHDSLTSRDNAEVAFRYLAVSAISLVQKLNDCRQIYLSKKYDEFSTELQLMQLELSIVLSREDRVSSRYTDSPVFSDAAMLLEFCRLVSTKIRPHCVDTTNAPKA